MGNFINGVVYDWQQYIINKNRSFDLSKFMVNNYSTNGAVVLITPLQAIMSECFAKRGDGYAHVDTMKSIYSSVYEENVKTNGEEIYNDLFTDDNNIRMRLCSSISINVIYIPSVITDSQYNYLVNFNNMIKNIYMKNKTYFDEFPMQFSSNLVDEYSLNNIDNIVAMARNNVGTFSYLDEYLIGEDISGNLSNSNIKRK